MAFQISREVYQHNLWIWGKQEPPLVTWPWNGQYQIYVGVATSQDRVFVLPQSAVTQFVMSVHSAVLFNATFGQKLQNLTSPQDGTLAYFRMWFLIWIRIVNKIYVYPVFVGPYPWNLAMHGAYFQDKTNPLVPARIDVWNVPACTQSNNVLCFLCSKRMICS